MIIHTTNDTWSAVHAVESILEELVMTDLGLELSDPEFNVLDGFRATIHEMLAKKDH